MTNNNSNQSPTSDNWNTYWQGTGDVGAYSSGGVSHPAIGAFWETFFQTTKQGNQKIRVIDIASGNGAVIECALKAIDSSQLEATALDVSSAAVENIQNRFPSVKGIVSDARNIPSEDGSFNLVTSQFGVEYAGHDAIYEASRLVADKGQIALLLHCESGLIHKESAQNLEACERLQLSQFISLASDMFEAGFKAVQGAERSAYELAAQKLAPAIKELEAIMKQFGPNVAGDTVVRIYNDVNQIHQRIQHYDPQEVLNWLNKMNEELNAYSGRMTSMMESAISEADFNQIKTELEDRGFTIGTADPLFAPDNNVPIAWVLIANKL